MHVTRNDFLKLGLSALGSVYLGCSSSGSSAGGGAGEGNVGTGGAASGGAASGGATSGGSSSGGASTGGTTSGGTNSGGSASGGSNTGVTCSTDITVTSSGESHTHMLTVTAAQLLASTDVELTSTDAFGHNHKVMITAADFAKLKAGETITKTTCQGGDHEFVLACGTPSREAAIPTCCSGDSAAACPN